MYLAKSQAPKLWIATMYACFHYLLKEGYIQSITVIYHHPLQYYYNILLLQQLRSGLVKQLAQHLQQVSYQCICSLLTPEEVDIPIFRECPKDRNPYPWNP